MYVVYFNTLDPLAAILLWWCGAYYHKINK